MTSTSVAAAAAPLNPATATGSGPATPRFRVFRDIGQTIIHSSANYVISNCTEMKSFLKHCVPLFSIQHTTVANGLQKATFTHQDWLSIVLRKNTIIFCSQNTRAKYTIRFKSRNLNYEHINDLKQITMEYGHMRITYGTNFDNVNHVWLSEETITLSPQVVYEIFETYVRKISTDLLVLQKHRIVCLLVCVAFASILVEDCKHANVFNSCFQLLQESISIDNYSISKRLHTIVNRLYFSILSLEKSKRHPLPCGELKLYSYVTYAMICEKNWIIDIAKYMKLMSHRPVHILNLCSNLNCIDPMCKIHIYREKLGHHSMECDSP